MIKAINSISCKTACGLAKDKVYLLLLAHPYHTVEFSPVFGLCTADALVCKYPHKYPLRIRVDVIGIVFYLYLIAVLLFFLPRIFTDILSFRRSTAPLSAMALSSSRRFSSGRLCS